MQTILLLLICIISETNALPLLSLSETQKLAANCSEKYGNPPAARVVTLDTGLDLLNFCANISEHVNILDFTDSNGEARRACLLITPSPKALPLLVWLHPSMFPSSTILLTDLVRQASKANLTGIGNGTLGYHMLLPFGRSTTHIYPAPADKGLGWDNWYRNYNRSDPALNVDVQTIDYFINKVVHNQSNNYHIDKSRVFMSGWSNGAAMAIEYALNTPGIAAAAVYSAPDPYRDYHNLCAQVPYPSHFTPILILYNQCDVINICTTGMAFIEDLNKRYKTNLTAELVIIDSLFQRTKTCNSHCTQAIGLGLLQHIRWPISLNDAVFFDFFRKHVFV